MSTGCKSLLWAALLGLSLALAGCDSGNGRSNGNLARNNSEISAWYNDYWLLIERGTLTEVQP